MVLDKEVRILVKSSRVIHQLKKINIESKIGDTIYVPIDNLWKGSNFEVRVKCDICHCEKKLQFSLYNKNVKKHNIYCCSNKCSSVKNKMTSLQKYGDENYNNYEKCRKTKLERYGNENYNNREKYRETNLERYGDENYNNREKYRETNLERYGVECTLELENIKNKIRETNLERYGVEDSRSSDYIKNKIRETNLERYGVEVYSKTKEYSKKVKSTSMNRYGVDSPNKSDIIKRKKIQSMLNRYGFISNSLTEESKKKLRETNLERYGVEYPMQVLEFCEKQQKNSKKIKYYNESIYYQSSYEKHFLDHMKNLGILEQVIRGGYIRYEFKGTKRTHYPDFYIDKYNLLIEIKSDYYYNKYLEMNISKMNKCVEMGYNYLFIINKNYNVLNEILNH